MNFSTVFSILVLVVANNALPTNSSSTAPNSQELKVSKDSSKPLTDIQASRKLYDQGPYWPWPWTTPSTNGAPKESFALNTLAKYDGVSLADQFPRPQLKAKYEAVSLADQFPKST